MPGAEQDTPAVISLGKKLYSEKRLSKNNTQACASCHGVGGRAGVDNCQRSNQIDHALVDMADPPWPTCFL
ncbi:MAG: hypothetical protein FJ404_15460 [Verrucomicrobia bacterium]|nr:hypothetical protein [Verrucomicrobiota bacterium]